MPIKRRAPMRKRRVVRRRKQQSGYRRVSKQQVFTETQKAGTECAGVNAQGEVQITAGTSGQGMKLLTQLNLLPQIGNYKSLWASYKILKAKFTIIPKWRGESYNEAAIGTAGAIGILETPRFAYAINDYLANTNAPLTEIQVLEDNGCKVRMFTKPVTVTCRPKPVLEQTNSGLPPGVQQVNTFAKINPWIEFDDAGPGVPHVGVDGFFTAQNSLTAGFASIADVYVTVTFACKDPR